MNYTLLMELVSKIGCGIAMGGAETYRVEESVNRILSAYGVKSRVYSVPNSLIITIFLVYLSSGINILSSMGWAQYVVPLTRDRYSVPFSK